MNRRLATCVARWPESYEGGYDPRCCRFPKSCSADVYDPARVSDSDLEPMPEKKGLPMTDTDTDTDTDTVEEKHASLPLDDHNCLMGLGYDLSPADCWASTACAHLGCGIRRDEHASEPEQSKFPELDIMAHRFVGPR